jgi:glycosyltransferase involved in cell wall biosynthesis
MRITVFTPTYNRADTLPVLAASLEAQDFQDYEWLVIDDGSTDGTIALLESWRTEKKLPLRFLTVPNGGKHRAINQALAAAKGEYFFIVDSDDKLPLGALEKIAALVPTVVADPECCGIMGLKGSFDGKLLGGLLPEGVASSDSLELTYTYHIRGDKAEVFKTDILRQFPFPELDGERFITECVVWFRIARAGYTLRLVNEILYEAEYQPDGLSARSVELRTRNPEGTFLFYRELIEGDLPFIAGIREAANLARFALLSGNWPRILNGIPFKTKLLVLVSFPIGWVLSLRDRAMTGIRV